MGQDESRPLVDEHTPPHTLESRDLKGLAKYIKERGVKRVVVMTGAGISTSAGIPDFRSPDTGLYANLARLNLPYAEAVFDISYFRNNPLPFYTLAHELYPGKYRPTIAHSFIKLLHQKGLLLKLFTQNIDCLEREAGVPGDMIVEAHGSFATQSCIECKEPYPDEHMKKAIHEKTVPHCPNCNGLVKPDIVFFGEALPSSFFNNRTLPSSADLVIIMGTSLSVHPFASLPDFAMEQTPRLLINMDRVGSLGSRPDDVLLLGDCDEGVRKVAEALGWLEELEALWGRTAPDKGKIEDNKKKTRDEQFQDEMDKLTKEIEQVLEVGDRQQQWMNDHLEEKKEKVENLELGKVATKDVDANNAEKEHMSAPFTAGGAESKLEPTESDRSKPDTGGGGALRHVFVGFD